MQTANNAVYKANATANAQAIFNYLLNSNEISWAFFDMLVAAKIMQQANTHDIDVRDTVLYNDSVLVTIVNYDTQSNMRVYKVSGELNNLTVVLV